MKRGAPGEVEFDAHEAEVALVALLSSFLAVTEHVKGTVSLVWSYDSLCALRTAAARTLAACVPARGYGEPSGDDAFPNYPQPDVLGDKVAREATAPKKRSHKRKAR